MPLGQVTYELACIFESKYRNKRVYESYDMTIICDKNYDMGLNSTSSSANIHFKYVEIFSSDIAETCLMSSLRTDSL